MNPSAFRRSWAEGDVALAFDGNSLVDPIYSDLCTQLQALAPLNGNFTISNKGISGQTVANMIANPSDIDSSWVSGKDNILIVWEVTNSIFNEGKTGLEACIELEAYLAARKAVHPWIVVLMTCIPRGDFLGGGYTAVTGGVQIDIANTYMRNNYRSMGVTALVEMRRGPFDFTDYTLATNFPAALWTNRTHPNSAGNAYVARYIADVLVGLRRRY